jgi:hypothetical protein
VVLETQSPPEGDARTVVNEHLEREVPARGHITPSEGLEGTPPDAPPPKPPADEELPEVNAAAFSRPEDGIRDRLGVDFEEKRPVLGRQPGAHSLLELSDRHGVRGPLILDELEIQLGEERKVFGGRFAKVH